jgi:hypothetical protein
MENPPFVKFLSEDGKHYTTLCLSYINIEVLNHRHIIRTPLYRRMAGHWALFSKELDGKLVVDKLLDEYDHVSIHQHLNDRELVECTEEEWREDNAGWIPKNWGEYEQVKMRWEGKWGGYDNRPFIRAREINRKWKEEQEALEALEEKRGVNE